MQVSESAVWVTWEEDALDTGKSRTEGSEGRACLAGWEEQEGQSE